MSSEIPPKDALPPPLVLPPAALVLILVLPLHVECNSRSRSFLASICLHARCSNSNCEAFTALDVVDAAVVVEVGSCKARASSVARSEVQGGGCMIRERRHEMAKLGRRLAITSIARK